MLKAVLINMGLVATLMVTKDLCLVKRSEKGYTKLRTFKKATQTNIGTLNLLYEAIYRALSRALAFCFGSG